MKNIHVLFIAVMAFSFNNFAQETDYRDTPQFGLKAGLNFSNVYDSEGEEFRADGKAGLAGGFFVAIPIGTYLGIQPEVLFSQKGFKGSGKILGANYNYVHNTNYLDIPIYFTLKPSEYITIVAGPQFSYLMSSKDVFNSGETSIEQEQEFENDDIRKNTLSFSTGLDINLNNVVIGARAAWDLLDNKKDGTSSTPRYKNQWVQVSIGYRFHAN